MTHFGLERFNWTPKRREKFTALARAIIRNSLLAEFSALFSRRFKRPPLDT
jgi:hypothetical protein